MRALDEAIAKRLVKNYGNDKPLKGLSLSVEQVIHIMSDLPEKPIIYIDRFFILCGWASKEITTIFDQSYYRGYQFREIKESK